MYSFSFTIHVFLSYRVMLWLSLMTQIQKTSFNFLGPNMSQTEIHLYTLSRKTVEITVDLKLNKKMKVSSKYVEIFNINTNVYNINFISIMLAEEFIDIQTQDLKYKFKSSLILLKNCIAFDKVHHYTLFVSWQNDKIVFAFWWQKLHARWICNLHNSLLYVYIYIYRVGEEKLLLPYSFLKTSIKHQSFHFSVFWAW